MKNLGGSVLLFALVAPAWSAEDAALKALQQNQLLRQQHQDQLQLKLQQYQHAVRNVPPDARQRQALEQLEMSQALRQQQLQLHQQRALAARPDAPSDDPGVRHAKAQIDQQRARQESRQQLQQFDRELQSKVDAGGQADEWRLPGAGTGGLATGLMVPSP